MAREFEVTPRRPVAELPAGGDGWWTTLSVTDENGSADFNVAVADRGQSPPTVAWITRRIRELGSDRDASTIKRLDALTQPHPVLAHPVIWLRTPQP